MLVTIWWDLMIHTLLMTNVNWYNLLGRNINFISLIYRNKYPKKLFKNKILIDVHLQMQIHQYVYRNVINKMAVLLGIKGCLNKLWYINSIKQVLQLCTGDSQESSLFWVSARLLSVLVSNALNIRKYNPHKQKLIGVLSDF